MFDILLVLYELNKYKILIPKETIVSFKTYQSHGTRIERPWHGARLPKHALTLRKPGWVPGMAMKFGSRVDLNLRLMDKILHYLLDPKLWELWHIPSCGSCRILSINSILNHEKPTQAYRAFVAGSLVGDSLREINGA